MSDLEQRALEEALEWCLNAMADNSKGGGPCSPGEYIEAQKDGRALLARCRKEGGEAVMELPSSYMSWEAARAELVALRARLAALEEAAGICDGVGTIRGRGDSQPSAQGPELGQAEIVPTEQQPKGKGCSGDTPPSLLSVVVDAIRSLEDEACGGAGTARLDAIRAEVRQALEEARDAE